MSKIHGGKVTAIDHINNELSFVAHPCNNEVNLSIYSNHTVQCCYNIYRLIYRANLITSVHDRQKIGQNYFEIETTY